MLLKVICEGVYTKAGSGFDLAWLSCLPSASVSSMYLVLYDLCRRIFFDYILFFTF